MPGLSWTNFLGSGFNCLMQMLTDLDSWGWMGTEGAEELCACVPSMGHGYPLVRMASWDWRCSSDPSMHGAFIEVTLYFCLPWSET